MAETKANPKDTVKAEKAAQQVTATVKDISKDSGAVSMHVKVYSPFKVYFDDTAFSISAVNRTGPFDILPQHHNFMTLLTPGDVVVRTDVTEEHIRISRGVMHVKADEVIVFLDV